MGAAQQLWLLYRNHREISGLQNPRRCTPVPLLLSWSARLILEQLPQGIFELLLDLGFVNGVFMPDSQNRFFAELLRVVNTANDQFQWL